MDSYADFELLIEREREGYWAKILHAPDGQAESPFTLPPEVDASRADVQGPWRNLAIQSPEAVDFEDFGQRLFRAVFSGQIESRWRGSLARTRAEHRKLRLRLHLGGDPDLLRVPWELLYDAAADFVALEMPLVRTLDIPVAPRQLAVKEPLRVLAILACPADVVPLQVEEEWQVLDQAFGEAIHLVKLIQPSLEKIEEHLRQGEWHVLHFVGHGFSDDQGGHLILEDLDQSGLPVGFEQLRLFLNHESLRLVVLNACAGARPGRDDPFSGVAQALVRKGIPAVVAMQREISDAAAIVFAKHFYGALARRLPIDEAMVAARRALCAGRHREEWAVPVLYLSTPDGEIVPGEVLDKATGGGKPPHVPWGRVAVIAGMILAVVAGLSVWGPWSGAEKEPKPLPRPTPAPNPPECPSPPGLGMAFVRIPAGIFSMGQETGVPDAEPVHQVRITRPFCLGVFEVTQGQWDAVLKKPPAAPEKRDLPVGGITFEAAQEFIELLNDQDPARPYRLPTEAEWEFAARAGTKTIYSFGGDPSALGMYANCRSDDGFEGAAPVGSFQPNSWGIYDMYGNVFEWVEDRYGGYPKTPQEDPLGPREGTRRVRRGGSWGSRPEVCSSAARSNVAPNWRRRDTGFRIVREIR